MKNSLFLFLFFILSSKTLAFSRYHQGLTFLKNGDKASAMTQFNGVPHGTIYFVKAINELSKLYFKENNWGKFFGHTFYYRNYLLSNKTQSNFNENILSLEALALAKHCRYKEANSLIFNSLTLAKKIGRTGAKLLKVKDQIKLLQEFDLLDKVSKKKKISNLQKLKFRWQLKEKILLKLKSPKDLHLDIKSQC